MIRRSLGPRQQQFLPPGREYAGLPVLAHPPLLLEPHGTVAQCVAAISVVDLIHESVEPGSGAVRHSSEEGELSRGSRGDLSQKTDVMLKRLDEMFKKWLAGDV